MGFRLFLAGLQKGTSRALELKRLQGIEGLGLLGFRVLEF